MRAETEVPATPIRGGEIRSATGPRFARSLALFAAVLGAGCSKPAEPVRAPDPAETIVLELDDVRSLPPVTLRVPRFVANRVDAEAGADYFLNGFDPERRFSATLVVQAEDDRRRARHEQCLEGTVVSRERVDGADVVTCAAPSFRSFDFRIEVPVPPGAAYCAAVWDAEGPLDETETAITESLVAACRTIRFGAGR